jgi:hypothetical protein
VEFATTGPVSGVSGSLNWENGLECSQICKKMAKFSISGRIRGVEKNRYESCYLHNYSNEEENP